MTKIVKSNLAPLRLMEFLQVMNNVDTFLQKNNPTTLGIQTLYTDFQNKCTQLEKQVTPDRKSEHTQKIHDLDLVRDRAYIDLLAYSRIITRHPEKEKADKAKKIVLIIEKYGKKVTARSLREETAIINNLIADLEETETQKIITAIGAEKWLEHLKNNNTQLENLHNTRTEEQATIEIGKTKELRQELQESFVKICTAINGLIVINGEEEYKNIVNAINQEIKKATL